MVNGKTYILYYLTVNWYANEKFGGYDMSMICCTCGIMLESVDETQIEKRGRFANTEYSCLAHKPLDIIER